MFSTSIVPRDFEISKKNVTLCHIKSHPLTPRTMTQQPKKSNPALRKVAFILFGITIFLWIAGSIFSDPEPDPENESISKKETPKDNAKSDSISAAEAARLLSDAKDFINDREFAEAKFALVDITNDHPNSKEAKQADSLIKIVDASIEELKEKQLSQIKRKLRKNVDEMEGNTWYYDKTTTRYNNVNSFHLYMGTSETSAPWLRFRIQYAGDRWLFIQKYIIKTDNNTYNFVPSKRVERDNQGGKVWEWFDESVSKKTYLMLVDVANSKSAKLRLSGRQYHKDKIISSKQKQALKNIIEAHELFGGASYK